MIIGVSDALFVVVRLHPRVASFRAEHHSTAIVVFIILLKVLYDLFARLYTIHDRH